ncbi:class I SAM-dependent methyltransferase [candidate division KSB1 bacterium]|nr:class I SAM-dependent methyltransferase [candidate division KSB1 bacterium]
MLDHFDIVAAVYDKVIGKHDASRLQHVLKLPVEGILLDAGGGTGRVSQQFRNLVRTIFITDISLAMLKQASTKGDLISINSHVETLPFPDDTFDRILVVDAFHHFCDQKKALQDLVRVLKPGGLAVIEEPDINKFSVKIVAILEKLALMRSHFHSPRKIQQMLSDIHIHSILESDGHFSVHIIFSKG